MGLVLIHPQPPFSLPPLSLGFHLGDVHVLGRPCTFHGLCGRDESPGGWGGLGLGACARFLISLKWPRALYNEKSLVLNHPVSSLLLICGPDPPPAFQKRKVLEIRSVNSKPPLQQKNPGCVLGMGRRKLAGSRLPRAPDPEIDAVCLVGCGLHPLFVWEVFRFCLFIWPHQVLVVACGIFDL